MLRVQPGGRAAAALATALLLLAAAGAAAAGGEAASAFAPLHTVFGAECSPYMDWQSVAVVYSHRKAGVPGPITRLLTCSEEALARYLNLDLVPTHVAPSYTYNTHNNDTYQAYNKPGAIMHWLAEAPPAESWILVADPDMIIRDTFQGWGTVYGAGRGWAVSVYFHYMQGVANNLSLTHVPEIAPRQDSLAGPVGRRGDQASAVVLMHRDDLAAVAPRWLHYSEVVRDDPMAWNETGDEYAQRPGMKPWISEMYGYSFGCATAGVWHRLDHAAMLYPGYQPIDKPMVLHFGRLFEIGAYRWQKHWFFGFKALLCPPWPHMSLPMTGKEAAPGVMGGLFPHPLHPSTFADQPPAEQYKQLLSISVIATINAALCERHLVNCPATPELQEQCGRALQLEHDTDAAILALERGAPPDGEPLCKDIKPEAECKGWADRQLCWQDPRFMHYYCRDTCGLCRLPAGRPLLPFGWDRAGGGGREASGHGGTGSAGSAARAQQWQPGALRLGRAGGLPLSHSEWHVPSIPPFRRDVLAQGMLAWGLLAAAVFGAAARSLWARRQVRRLGVGSASEQAKLKSLTALLGRQLGGGSRGMSSSSSGNASPPRLHKVYPSNLSV